MPAVCHGEGPIDPFAAIDRVRGGQYASEPVDLEDPQALAIEGQGPDLIVNHQERAGRGDRGPGRRP